MVLTDAYRFANTIWIDDLIGTPFNSRSVGRAIAFATAPWIFGLVICLCGGIYVNYLRTPAYYVGSLGIFLTTCGIAYGSKNQYKIYDRLTSCFELNEQRRRKHILHALGRHSQFSNHIRGGFIIFLIGAAITISSAFLWDHVSVVSQQFGTYLPRFRALEEYGWYQDNVIWYTVTIVLIFLLFISATLGTSTSIILKMPIFLWRVSKEIPRLPPTLIKTHFAPAATFYSVISLLWLAGVGMIFYFFGLNNDWISDLFVATAFIFGVINFSVPQITYLRTVSASEERYLAVISRRFDNHQLDEASIPLGREKGDGDDDLTDIRTGTLLHLMKYDDWVYPLHQTYVVVGTYIGSLVASAIGWERLYELISTRLK